MATEQNGKQPSRQLVRHLIRRGFALAVLAAVVAGAYLYLRDTDHAPGLEQANQGPVEPPEVAVMSVTAGAVPLRHASVGQTEAVQRVEIRARVRGFIEEQAFAEGSLVQAGQVLFKIDSRSFQAEVKVAQARLASAKAQLVRAQQQVTRYEQLLAQNAATTSELEQWQMDAGVAEANVELAEAQLEQAKLDLSYTSIESPITGMIGKALKDVGSYVDEGTDGLLAVVQQIDPITVRYSVSESDLLRRQEMIESGRLRILNSEGADVTVTLSNGRVYPHRGTFDFMDVAIDPSTGTAQIRAEVPNPDAALRPGQFVHVHTLGMEQTNAILIPQKAVMLTPGGASVYVLNPEHQVVQRTVQLGEWHNDDTWLIEQGLEPGDRLVVSHLGKVRPGMAVTPAPVPVTTEATASR